MMDEMILNVNTLPELLHRRIRSDRVRVREENGVIMLMPIGESRAINANGRGTEAFSVPENFQTKDERREILRSLYGSIDDPTFTEPPEIKYESPRDWELMDQ